ncbi:regulator [Streptomyces mirabilis]|uniref:regulator n=1 Tax=Streptomyces mirabilis TaxID=68239 RepID=UPI0036934B20
MIEGLQPDAFLDRHHVEKTAGREHARRTGVVRPYCTAHHRIVGSRGQPLDAPSGHPLHVIFSTVAEATLLAGWMSYDACHHGLAQRYFLQALRLAQDANDRRFAGSVLSAMSHQATFLGHNTEAATLARAALMGISPVATPTLRAQFHAMEARALARTGDVRACEAALSAATRALESRNNGDEPEWISYFDEAELAAEAAHCFRDVNSARQAVAHAENAMSGSHVRSDFFATMVLADAHLRAGDIEEACRVALDALELGEQLKSARCLSYLSEFRSSMARVGGSPVIRTFEEEAQEYRMWVATTTRPPLPNSDF